MARQHASAAGTDEFNLMRFVEAQEPVFRQAVSELRAGRKMSHWMWFVFPQVRGLGRSPTAIEYAISGPDEARAYLAHPVLGARLKECTQLVLGAENRSAAQIFGSPDDMKFRSCMTLFAQVSPEDDIFVQALKKYFDGVPDQLTLDRI
ncbi:MAG TPA: DUF1810 domain-containing protein [Candidatus Binatia bacterium]|nr:DUF1810 domain-containing protein [Candidatus Binatia bacterium]